MNYKVLLIDLDDTLLDFQKSEEYAIRKTMETLKINPTDELVNVYKQINQKYWKMFERKEITRDDLLKARFKEFCELLNLQNEDYAIINDTYFNNLSTMPFEIEGAYDFLEKLSQYYDIYVITNGVKKVQEKRLSLVNIGKFFKKIYISEEIGYHKPQLEYFNYVLNDLHITNKNEVLIIGDSLSSDIQGGINSNIDTMWYNPKNKRTDVKYTYMINNYDDFFRIIK